METPVKRPTRYDENVVHLAATKLIAQLKASSPDLFDEALGYTDEATHAQFVRALDGSSRDGYEIAKDLERQGWEIDADLVSELHGGCLDEAYDELVKKWISWHAIKPLLVVGAVVTVKPHLFDTNKVEAEGEITEFDMKRGTYTVYVPAWGHVKSGVGTLGNIYPWEDLEHAQASTGAAA
jgi:hypothetical protein